MFIDLFFTQLDATFLTSTNAKYFNFSAASEKADTAYGVFCLFNMIIYMVYAIILSVHKRSVMASTSDALAHKGDDNEIVHSKTGYDGGEYGDEQEV